MDNPALYLAPLLGAGLLAYALIVGGRELRANPPREAIVMVVPDSPKLLAAVIINPSKFDDPESAKETISQQASEHGWQVRFVETTVDDPGFGQTRQALADEPSLVIACGGDGTVRAVAQELAGGTTRMGLLPAGTGNLLARNLDLPLDDLAAAMDVALAGDDRQIDVGWLSLDNGEEQAFLVMAGVGFDAEIMADAPEELKAKVGTAAYVVSGVRKLNGDRKRVRVQIDDRVIIRSVRSVVIGNCGKLQGGLELMPEAEIDDGILDVLVLSPKGIVGWAAVVGQVLTRQQRGHPVAQIIRGEDATITAAGELSAQLDGDPVGKMHTAHARVARRALTIRVHRGPVSKVRLG